MEVSKFKSITQETNSVNVHRRDGDNRASYRAPRQYNNSDGTGPCNNNRNNTTSNSGSMDHQASSTVSTTTNNSHRRSSRNSIDSNSSNDHEDHYTHYPHHHYHYHHNPHHHHHHHQQQNSSNISARLSKARNSTDYSTEENGESPNGGHRSVLNRRSSSAMRVRELRDVLTSMTTSQEEDEEQEMKGSQKARLLVASQQRLMSRLQDLSHQLDSMDNEVTRVKGDIVSSRRYFSAMTGIPYGPDWPTSRQMDSAYTSPTSFMTSPGSSDDSPCPSDTDWPPSPALAATSSPTPETGSHKRDFRSKKMPDPRTPPVNGAGNLELEHRRLSAASPKCSSGGVDPQTRRWSASREQSFHSRRSASFRHTKHCSAETHPRQASACRTEHEERPGSAGGHRGTNFDRFAHSESPFRSLADFDDSTDPQSTIEGRESAGFLSGGPLLTRSDSCSSFMSWRSDVEMATLFPEEAECGTIDNGLSRYGEK